MPRSGSESNQDNPHYKRNLHDKSRLPEEAVYIVMLGLVMEVGIAMGLLLVGSIAVSRQ